MDLQTFAHEENVIRFSERLKIEDDPRMRKSLSTLLLDEENKFAATAERLHKTESDIARCKLHIVRQYHLIDKLKTDGHDVAPAEQLLRNIMELHDLYVSFRQVLLGRLDRQAL